MYLYHPQNFYYFQVVNCFYIAVICYEQNAIIIQLEHFARCCMLRNLLLLCSTYV
jgi:hypothetical protein